MNATSLLRADLAIDLGTAMTRVQRRDASDVREAPTQRTDQVPASPLRNGVVINERVAVSVLEPMVRSACRWTVGQPRAIACIPSLATGAERQRLSSVLRRAGVGAYCIVPEPLAAAVGAGLDISKDQARMVMDVGAGVTDVAILRDGQVTATFARAVGCTRLTRTLLHWLFEHRDLLVTEEDVAPLLQEAAVDASRPLMFNGMDRWSSRRVRAVIPGREAAHAVQEVAAAIVGVALQAYRAVDERTAAELLEQPVILTGGGACMPWLVRSVASATGLECQPALDPVRCVVRGAAEMFVGVDATGAWEMADA